MHESRTNAPSVAVYITTKDRCAMLERAVRSVLEQDYPPSEILIVDDGSSDETQTYLTKLQSSNPKVRVFRNDVSRGAPESRNIAIRKARSTYLTGLDDDDEFRSNRLKDFVDHAHMLTGYAALGTSLVLQRKRIRIQRVPRMQSIGLRDLLFKNHVGNQVFTYTARWRSIGGFDYEFPAMQDYDCWVRLVHQFGPIYMIDNRSSIIHMEHEKPRVTAAERRAAAAALFYSKHAHLLDRDHKKAGQLHRLICSGSPMTLRFALENYVPELRREFWRYALLSNSNALRRLKSRIFS